MEWLIAALAVVAIAMAAVASTGRGGGMPDLVDDRVAPSLPAGELTAADLVDVEFAVVPRGYSMTQVDALLARLVAQLGGVAPEAAPLDVDLLGKNEEPAPAVPSTVVYGPVTDLQTGADGRPN